MARKRMISPQIWDKRKFYSLNLRQRLLFIGLFSNADDFGKLEGEPVVVKSKIFPADKISKRMIENDLDVLHKKGFIIWYKSIDNNRFIMLKNWDKHQKVPHKCPSTIPEPFTNHSRTNHEPITNDSRTIHDQFKRKETKIKKPNKALVNNHTARAREEKNDKKDLANLKDRSSKNWLDNVLKNIVTGEDYLTTSPKEIQSFADKFELLFEEKLDASHLKTIFESNESVRSQQCSSLQRPWIHVMYIAVRRMMEKTKKTKLPKPVHFFMAGVFNKNGVPYLLRPTAEEEAAGINYKRRE